jgi:DNA invertase Pin-like site-specific DNA recombinase
MTPRPTVTALGYVRMSSESDARTVSLDTQRAAIERYATEKGWTLVEVLSDDGVSGGRRERLTRLAERVKATRASRVVVFHLDRLARDIVATLDAIRGFAKKGIELHVPGRGVIEVQSATGFLTTSMEGTIAEHYRRLCSERSRSALAHLRDQGRRWARVEADPVEAAVVAKARALRRQGLSLRAVSAALGPVSRAGTPLSAETLNAILHRPS